MNKIKRISRKIISIGSSSKKREDTADEGSTGSTGGTGTGGRTRMRGTISAGGSFLIAETTTMERERRLAEQEGHRKLASVKARDHSADNQEKNKDFANEGEYQNDMLQHPDLATQRFDGIDPNLNPEPPLNSTARMEYDNEKRNQEQEKQLRLGNMPKFSTAPTPKGP